MALVAGVISLLLALVIPATGYYVVFVQPLRETAIVVNDRSYSWGDYLTRTRMVIAQAQVTGAWQPDTLNSLIFDMFEEVERQEIVRQFAGQEGITASPEEIDRQVRSRVLGANLMDDPSITDSEYRERYRRRLELLKVDAAQFRDIQEMEVLRRNLDASLRANVPQTLLQRYLRVIQVSEIEDARAALARIDGGEEFSIVATDLSRDTQTASLGGDLGWIPLGVRDEFDSVLFTLTDGEVSAPLYGQSGVFIIQAIGEAEMQPVAERHRSRLEIQAMTQWQLARRRELVAIGGLSRPNGGMTTSRYNWVLEQLQQDRELFPRRSASG